MKSTGNEIGEEGATAIATMLRENRTLKEVDLASNAISEDGLWLFAQVMSSSNRTLTTLQLLCNAQTDTNILDVVDAALANNRDTDCLSFVCSHRFTSKQHHNFCSTPSRFNKQHS